MKINFKKIPYTEIDGTEAYADIKNDMSSILFHRGENYDEFNLGNEIYKSDEIDLDEKQVEIIKKWVKAFPFFIQAAFERLVES